MHTVVSVKNPFLIGWLSLGFIATITIVLPASLLSPPNPWSGRRWRSRLLALLGLCFLDTVRSLRAFADDGEVPAILLPLRRRRRAGDELAARHDPTKTAPATGLDVPGEGLRLLDEHVRIGDERDELVRRVPLH